MQGSSPRNDAGERDPTQTTGATASESKTDRNAGERSQPDPKKMQKPPLRTEQPAQRNERGSPNVHMDEGHEDEDAATQGERPKFDR